MILIFAQHANVKRIVPMFRIYQLSLYHGTVSKLGTLVSIFYQVQSNWSLYILVADLASSFVYMHGMHTFIISSHFIFPGPFPGYIFAILIILFLIVYINFTMPI